MDMLIWESELVGIFTASRLANLDMKYVLGCPLWFK